MTIRQWAVRDRPRERMRTHGPVALSDRELLAALIGSGGRTGSAFDVAGAVLSCARGSISGLARVDGAVLERLSGVGPATATRLLAALELGRRVAATPLERGARIRGPADVHRLLGPAVRDLAQEEFHALLLDTRRRRLQDVLVSRGTADASLVHPREVFRAAVATGAAALILVHNHPSGDPTPSSEDRSVTRQLREAGRTLGIPVLDHVIVGDGRWTSLAEDGALQPS